jgi:DNA (cytosine-5)-methyltransferase 1
MEEDERNQLVFSYISFIKLVRPKLLLFENVKGFTYSFDKTKNPDAIPYSKIVVEQLDGLGYDVTPYIINFAEFGVPQRRKRFILVGVRKSMGVRSNEFMGRLRKQLPEFVAQYGLTKAPTLSDAISDLLKSNGTTQTPDRRGFQSGRYGKPTTSFQIFLRSGISETQNIPNSHSFAKHSLEKISCFKRLLLEKEIVMGKRIDGNARKKWGIRQRGITVLDPNAVSPTITGAPDDYLHYSEPRIMTVRECARIQTFPDWFEFKSKYTTGGEMRKKEVPRYSQVGNAIPPLFAQQAGLVLKSLLL